MITFAEFVERYFSDHCHHLIGARSRSLGATINEFFARRESGERPLLPVPFFGGGLTTTAEAILAYAVHRGDRFIVYVTYSNDAADRIGRHLENLVNDRRQLIYRRQPRDRGTEPVTLLHAAGVNSQCHGLKRTVRDHTEAFRDGDRWEGVGRRIVRPDLVVIDDPYAGEVLRSPKRTEQTRRAARQWEQLGPAIHLYR
ncbi:hypothetical protein [Roseiconus lacunae]|uniref:Uncharacterized protein n=1 Tax=Roseiconus lacunae TaxID=2605694 RepID=A0ABT7PI94_9BACT|nr:hypothetical protein [Roseiconus lacunae]MDM4015971.1 hypothetical protein [Roseiconus lacunae]